MLYSDTRLSWMNRGQNYTVPAGTRREEEVAAGDMLFYNRQGGINQ
jgi:hypothetical protein